MACIIYVFLQLAFCETQQLTETCKSYLIFLNDFIVFPFKAHNIVANHFTMKVLYFLPNNQGPLNRVLMNSGAGEALLQVFLAYSTSRGETGRDLMCKGK